MLLKRTRYCGELRASDIGTEHVLTGWVQRRRDHGGLIFIDLRDRTGLTQVVLNPELSEETHAAGRQIRSEYVLGVQGKVEARPEGTVNPNLPTGEIEIPATQIEILNIAATPPFLIEDDQDIKEEARLTYRYLDLRRPRMYRNMELRHKVTMAVRRYMDEQGYLEVETPFMIKSTPEGAREFLVPSRLNPGQFYALAQSPQMFKQMLMVGGLDKYFQIVRCFRDEDLRGDRQPEFTQIDIELSFGGQAEVFALVEGMLKAIFGVKGVEIPTPFPRLPYHEAMERFGSDKPDTRFGMELKDIADLAEQSDFRVFKTALEGGGMAKGLGVEGGAAKFSRKDLDDLAAFVANFKAKGLAWMRVTAEGADSPIAKFFKPETLAALLERMGAKPGDLLLFVADARPKTVYDALGALRLELGKRLGLIDKDRLDFLWVVDFPLFSWDEEAGRYFSEHHPFTAPNYEDIIQLEVDPTKVRSQSYDCVLNGNEIAGGSVRIHRSDIQEKVFRILNFQPDEIKERFGFFLDALQFGTPPHAGIAAGLDRIVMLLAGESYIRDVIAFPKTQKGTDLVTGAPANVPEEQLKELFIQLRPLPTKEKES